MKLCSMILIQVNVPGIEAYKDKLQVAPFQPKAFYDFTIVPHFSLGCPDKKRAEYLSIICFFRDDRKLQGTIYRNDCSPKTSLQYHLLRVLLQKHKIGYHVYVY